MHGVSDFRRIQNTIRALRITDWSNLHMHVALLQEQLIYTFQTHSLVKKRQETLRSAYFYAVYCVLVPVLIKISFSFFAALHVLQKIRIRVMTISPEIR